MFRFFRIKYVRRRAYTHSRRLYLAHKESARALVSERLTYFNQHYGLPLGKVSIRNQKSRWGSCSKKGNLNFNYKLVFLAPELRDYVIVHEICHVKEFNHGQGFWDLVAQKVPEHRTMRHKLRKVVLDQRQILQTETSRPNFLQPQILQK